MINVTNQFVGLGSSRSTGVNTIKIEHNNTILYISEAVNGQLLIRECKQERIASDRRKKKTVFETIWREGE